MISEIKNPFERYLAFIRERDAIYHRKIAGCPWPWTEDTILQSYRFTEIYRERDRTSLHYQKTIRNRYGQDDAWILPATVFYRWFNRVETCEYFFDQPDLLDYKNPCVFERYFNHDCDVKILLECLVKIPPPHVTGAFIITGKPGYAKGEGVVFYFHDWCKKPWEAKWREWRFGNKPPSLQEMYDWLREDAAGLGSFMTAQLVADLKYLSFMQEAVGWWLWAAPGPGSQKGLNAVLGRPMDQAWNKDDWLAELQILNAKENSHLIDIGHFHCQDTQNHCCEFSKYEKVRTGAGRPRQIYRRAEAC
jgi:alpha-glutamyl/putrescinyl thymine pyrophosphorylase clade 1